jgi:phosphoglycerate dehydrogenase-like enzyme
MAVVKILIDMPVHRPLLEKLRGLGDIEVRVVKVPEKRCRPLPNRLIRDIEILGCYCPPKNLSEMTRLRWVQITSSGYNQLAGLDLVKRGIRVANARGSSDIQIAEWNIAMMVNLVRDLRQMIRNQDRHIWDNSARFQQEIRGLTAGVWGYGGIGRETARLAKAMGMAVHVLSREGVRPAKGRYFVPGTGDPKGKMPDCERWRERASILVI